jgi:hypothetical protein
MQEKTGCEELNELEMLENQDNFNVGVESEYIET